VRSCRTPPRTCRGAARSPPGQSSWGGRRRGGERGRRGRPRRCRRAAAGRPRRRRPRIGAGCRLGATASMVTASMRRRCMRRCRWSSRPGRGGQCSLRAGRWQGWRGWRSASGCRCCCCCYSADAAACCCERGPQGAVYAWQS